MKRLLSLCVVAACMGLGGAMLHAKVKKVHVAAGNLHSLVTPQDLKKTDALEISGTLNNSDIIYLRYICGRDTLGRETTSRIRSLNLQRVKFENSGAPYFLRYKNAYSVTSPNALPQCMFYDVPIENLVLPESMDTLGAFSLVGTRLKEINIPDHVVFPNIAVAKDTLLRVLRLPDMKSGLSPRECGLPNLSVIRYGNLDYMPSGAFADMPNLEEIIFDGMIGHIDGYMISNCPRLRRVVFNGPILSTGGRIFAQNCPQLEEIQFNSFVVGLGLVANDSCPSLRGITVNGAVMASVDSAAVSPTPSAVIKSRPDMIAQLKRLIDWQIDNMGAKGFLGRITRGYAPEIKDSLVAFGLTREAERLDSAYQVNRNPDEGKSKLQILKEAAPYSRYTGDEDLTVKYARPDDPLLTRSREHFNLDSIAGSGDDISRIKNLMYWVHDLVRHDGSSAWPDCSFNLVDLANVCDKENRGLNCRFMAMMLTEALLAEGIPARYLTCIPKAYDDDPDCHVITVAWAESLGKWVWVDPTFAAFVTDENGLMLHPGEVRYRLQHDLPLVLNEDANWNHDTPQTKEDYLDSYMAKNLYIISTNLIQQSEPEGRAMHRKGKFCALVPTGFDFPNSHYTISDDSIFWLPPVR